MILGQVWGFTNGILSILGMLSIFILFLIISDLFRLKFNIPDSVVAGVLVLYGLGTLFAVLCLSLSLALSALFLLFG